MPPLVVVIDDEPIVGDGIGNYLRSEAGAGAGGLELVEVRSIDRPRRLGDFDDLHLVTHAVVDLSYGRDDIDGPCLLPERETGTDAIDFLRDRCPWCRIVVATRNDTSVATEMAVAIRQTWPDIAFLHKADRRLAQQVAAFVRGAHRQDNAEIALDLIGVEPVSLERLRRVVEATSRARPTARLLMALADCPAASPSRSAVAELLAVSESYVRSLAHDVTYELRERNLLGADRGGLHSLWSWARARRAVLRRALGPLLD